jgi:hypothetical protein
MCGGKYGAFPKQLNRILGEQIIERTIRLLKAYGITDIAISTTNNFFDGIAKKNKVDILRHDNDFIYGKNTHSWLKAFYPMKKPVCYIFGDVYFSEDAIRKIVKTETNSIQFFASAPPFHEKYTKIWAEPFAFKVQDPELFFRKIEECHKYDLEGRFHREAVSWELWQVIKGGPLDVIDYTNYVAINDYTCDIDDDVEALMFERRVFGV